MSSFPTNARTGQTHKKFGRKYAYSETTGTWAPVVPLASVAEVRKAEATAASATQFYALATDLPLSGNTAGSMAFVQETNRLYLWSGTGWYNVATISGATSSISGANSSYTLATDGTPIVITLSQTGLTSPTWSYQVTTGSLGRTATVTQADNVFTITPSTRARDIGSFGITFKATDGSNTLVTTSQFSMSNTAPVIGTGPSATYTLASDGTPTVITLAATDADGHAITWSYNVSSGSLGDTVVSNVGNVFTVTPGISEVSFDLSFIASDGAGQTSALSSFTLSFPKPDWPNATLTYIFNPDSNPANDLFGDGVSIDGIYALIGAQTDDQLGAQAGKAYIFDVSTNTLKSTLTNPNSSPATDYFGGNVCIKGSYAVVAAQYAQNSSNTENSGIVYVYKTTNGTWSDATLIHTINNPNIRYQPNDQFGLAIAIEGNYLVVGSAEYGPGNIANQGVVYIYDLITGSQITYIDNPNANQGGLAFFGRKVAISGNYLITSGYMETTTVDGTGYLYSGRAYIFKTTTGDWTDVTLVHAIDNPNAYGTPESDTFGNFVAIAGNYAAVAANGEDDAGGTGSGKVYVFNVTTGALLYTLDNPDYQPSSANDSFGTEIAMDADSIGVSAPSERKITYDGSGVVYVFRTSTGALLHTFENANHTPGYAYDFFGYRLSLSGQRIAVHAKDDVGDQNTGIVYVFTAPLV